MLQIAIIKTIYKFRFSEFVDNGMIRINELLL